MMVCAFWSIVLILDWSAAHDKLRLWLWQFMVVAVLLYMGHAVFFNHNTSILPFTDTLYCACNLLVFPLYHMYIKGLSVPHYLDNRRQLWHDRCILFLPALVIFLIIGVLYLMMSSAERSDFIETYFFDIHSAEYNATAEDSTDPEDRLVTLRAKDQLRFVRRDGSVGNEYMKDTH